MPNAFIESKNDVHCIALPGRAQDCNSVDIQFSVCVGHGIAIGARVDY